MAEVLRVDQHDGIAVLTMNRPDSLNALSRELREALVGTFRELSMSPDIGVVILTGSGRAFSAGIDLKELADEREHARILEAIGENEMVRAITAFDRPIIGAVNGFAVTGGLELALLCDFLIASTEARFADTHARVGIVPGWGLSQRLSRRIGIARAKELSFTGNYIDAQTAAAWGLLNRVVPPDELLAACLELAREMLSCDRAILAAHKHLIDIGVATTLSHGLREEARTQRQHASTLTGPGDRRTPQCRSQSGTIAVIICLNSATMTSMTFGR